MCDIEIKEFINIKSNVRSRIRGRKEGDGGIEERRGGGEEELKGNLHI